jgi:hypothetical protein
MKLLDLCDWVMSQKSIIECSDGSRMRRDATFDICLPYACIYRSGSEDLEGLFVNRRYAPLGSMNNNVLWGDSDKWVKLKSKSIPESGVLLDRTYFYVGRLSSKKNKSLSLYKKHLALIELSEPDHDFSYALRIRW